MRLRIEEGGKYQAFLKLTLENDLGRDQRDSRICKSNQKQGKLLFFFLKALVKHLWIWTMQFHYSCFSSTQGTYLQKSRERVCYYKGDSSSQMYLSYLQKESESSVLRLFPLLKAAASSLSLLESYTKVSWKRRKKPFDQRLSTFFAPSFPDVLWNFANHKSRKLPCFLSALEAQRKGGVGKSVRRDFNLNYELGILVKERELC